MKKVTLLFLMLFAAIGFAQQTTLKSKGVDNPTYYNAPPKGKSVVLTEGQRPADAKMMNLGENKPRFIYEQNASASKDNSAEARQLVATPAQRAAYQQTYVPFYVPRSPQDNSEAARQLVISPEQKAALLSDTKPLLGALDAPLFRTLTAQDEAEILADAMYRANRPIGMDPQGATVNRNPEDDIIPTAGATQTFTPALGDHFFDPGGPGGGPTGGTPGNYPNCNCDTKTTLSGVNEINFLFFSVFATFDYIKIYDGTDATGTILYDNGAGGANSGDITLADMIASHGSSTFTSTSGNFFFLFHASAVVDYGGWDVEITGLGGGGGGPFPAPYCPVAFSTVEPITLVEVAGISNRTSPVVNGSPAHEDYTAVVGNMQEGESYSIALEGNTDGGFTASFTVFIDWNQDGILDNASERYQIGTINGSTGVDGKQATGTIVVPAGVVPGPTRMRVMKKFSAPYVVDSCTGTSYGQAEDYTIVVAAAGGPFPEPYCGVDFSTVEPITLVDVAGISNRSSEVVNGSPAHEDFTSVVGNMEEGMSYPIALEGNTDGGFTCSFTVFIDWNQDGILDNASERYQIGTINGSTGVDGKQATGTIVVPAGVVAGPTRMRVMKKFSAPYVVDSCTGTSYGQAEDYTIMVTAGGGGGGTACSQSHPFGAVAAGASGSSVNSDFKTAADIVVAAGQDFTLNTIEVPFLTFAPLDPPTTAKVVYYENAGGLPGAMLGTETVVPTILSSGPWANPVAFQFMTSLAVNHTFLGDASSPTTYWIEVSMGTATSQGTVFWEYSNDIPVEGFPYAKFDASVGTWTSAPAGEEVIYTFSGECDPIGGGGAACSQDHPFGAVAAGASGSSVNSDFKTAADIVVAAGEDFTLNTIEVPFLTFAPLDPPTTAKVVYYENAGGLPGLMLGTETVVPTILSSGPWANPVAFQFMTSLAVNHTFLGDASSATTYWIEVSMGTATSQGTVFWEYSNDIPVEGFPYAKFDASVGTWTSAPAGEEVIYTFSGDCNPMGGGGGVACSQDNPENAFENGFTTSKDGSQIIATDINVPADTDFSLEKMTVNIWMAPGSTLTSADISFYNNSGDLPGSVRSSYPAVVPVSQTVIGNNFGWDISEVVFEIAPEMLPGTAGVVSRYWVSLYAAISSGSGFIGSTSATTQGVSNSFSSDAGATWNVNAGWDTVYKFEGTCVVSGGGGGDPCSATSPSNAFENGKSFTKNLGRITAADITVAADQDFMLETINLNAFIGSVGSGVNASNMDVFIYADSGAGTPGALLTSQIGLVPVSQTVIGNNFGYDAWSIDLDIADYNLVGQAGATTTYWIGLSLEPTDGSNTFWEYTSAAVVGYGLGYNDGSGFVMEPGNETVYTFAGTCSPTGGGGGITNDECSGAIAVSCGSSVNGTTVGATIDSSAPTCGPSISSPGVWYTLDDNSGIPGNITVSLCTGTTFDTKLSIYTGSCSALVCVDGNDDACGLQSRVTFASNGNTKYYILVHSFGGETGAFTLDVTCEVIGISENAFEGFSYYPNPTSDILNLKSIDNIENVSLFNLLGQRVLDNKVNATTSKLDISGLSTGTYLMKVTVNGQTGTYKVLKQ